MKEAFSKLSKAYEQLKDDYKVLKDEYSSEKGKREDCEDKVQSMRIELAVQKSKVDYQIIIIETSKKKLNESNVGKGKWMAKYEDLVTKYKEEGGEKEKPPKENCTVYYNAVLDGVETNGDNNWETVSKAIEEADDELARREKNVQKINQARILLKDNGEGYDNYIDIFKRCQNVWEKILLHNKYIFLAEIFQ